MFAKRSLWWLIIVVLAGGLLLAACAPAATPAPAVEEPAAEEPAAEEPAAEEPAVEEPAAEEPAEEEDFLVAFGHVGPISDEGWTWSHHVGAMAVERELGVRTVMVESMPFSEETTRILEQFVADGAKVIFITSEYADFVYTVADAHPEVVFLEANGHRTTDNMINYYIEHWDPSFLIGMAAGLMTESNQLGYVGSYPIDSVYTSVNAFHLGARSVNPDVTTSVVLINSWFDPSAANIAANTLIDAGADFLFGIMDEAAYLEVAQERGVWAAMWNTDIRQYGPDAYVSSMMLFWDDFYVEEVRAAMEGTWQGNRETVLLPMPTYTDRDEWGQNVPQEVRDQVDAMRDRMINEGYNPFVGPIYDTDGNLVIAEGEELSDAYLYREWVWAVEGVTGLP